ncbi:InlB B-repeat-containing protein, partial [Porphyromonas sp.]
MKRLLPIWLCLLALTVTHLYGQQKSLQQAVESDKYTVTFFATPTEGGTLSAVYFDENSRLITLQSGEQLAQYTGLYITATPSDGYTLEKWIVNGDELSLNPNNPLDYNCRVEEDLIVEAVFKRNTPAPSKVKLTYGVATEGGKLSVLAYPATGDPYTVNSGDEVDYATNLFFQAEADPGYTVEKWTVNGKEDTSAGNDNMLSMAIQEDSDVQVYFKKADDTSDGYSVT